MVFVTPLVGGQQEEDEQAFDDGRDDNCIVTVVNVLLVEERDESFEAEIEIELLGLEDVELLPLKVDEESIAEELDIEDVLLVGLREDETPYFEEDVELTRLKVVDESNFAEELILDKEKDEDENKDDALFADLDVKVEEVLLTLFDEIVVVVTVVVDAEMPTQT